MYYNQVLIIVMTISCAAIKQDYTELRSCTFKGSVADPNDCSSYYHCEEGKLFHYHCGMASAFDPAIQTCVSPPKDPSCLRDKEDKMRENTLNDNEDTYVCEQDGYFPDPSDCRRFYRCSTHSKHAFSCPVGLGFDSIKITCDPIEKVENCAFGKRVRALDAKEGPSQKVTTRQQNANQNFRKNNPNTLPSIDRKSQEPVPNTIPRKQVSRHPPEDLFYFWNFDGMTDFDDYISLEEAAKMDYKMPPGFAGFNYDNNIPQASNPPKSDDVPVGFTERNQNSFLQKQRSSKQNKNIEAKQGRPNGEYSTFNPWNVPLRKSTSRNDNKMQMAPDWRNSYDSNNIFNKNRAPYESNFPKNIYPYDDSEKMFQIQDTPLKYKPEQVKEEVNIMKTKPTESLKGKEAPMNEYNNIKKSFNNNNKSPPGSDKRYSTIEIAYNSPNSFDVGRKAPQKPLAAPHVHYATTGQGAYAQPYQEQPLYRRRIISPSLIPYDHVGHADPFHCPQDGYFRDEKDCSRFYHCTHGLPYLVKCNGGLYFNPANKICDWPARVPACSVGMRKVFVSPQRLRLDDDANVSDLSAKQKESKASTSAELTDDSELKLQPKSQTGEPSRNPTIPPTTAYSVYQKKRTPKPENKNQKEGVKETMAHQDENVKEKDKYGNIQNKNNQYRHPIKNVRTQQRKLDHKDDYMLEKEKYGDSQNKNKENRHPTENMMTQQQKLAPQDENVPEKEKHGYIQNKNKPIRHTTPHTMMQQRKLVPIAGNDCEKTGYFRHATDCSVFYKCTSDAKFEYTCEKGTAFHKGLKACVSVEYVDDCEQ